jgi:hypothetical protein
MLVVLHGSSSVKVLVLLTLNYQTSKSRKPANLDKIWPILLVVGNMGLLFMNERYDGYRYAQLHSSLSKLVRISMRALLGS